MPEGGTEQSEGLCWECLENQAVEELHTREQFCDDCLQTGEIITQSELTDCWYRVTKWIDKGDGKILSLVKEEIDEDEVRSLRTGVDRSGGDPDA